MIYTKDEQIVRELAKRIAEIAHEPNQEDLRKHWRNLNDLKPTKAMTLIWGGGIPWHEMDQSALTRECEDNNLAGYEISMKQTLFRHEYLPDDMVVDRWIKSPLVIRDTGNGLPGWTSEQFIERLMNSHTSAITSRSFKPALFTEDDLDKLHMPMVSFDSTETDRLFEQRALLFDGIMEVRKAGVAVVHFWPWNDLIAWVGMDRALLFMHEAPGFLHKIMDRVVANQMSRLDQYERLGLIDGGSGTENVGTGGYSFNSSIPLTVSQGRTMSTQSLWVTTAGEIFSCVSPEMHNEFALRHELEVHRRFGLVSYGCCEPLDRNIQYLRQIQNLRTISISAWVDVDNAASQMKGDYVFSWRPENTSISSFSWEPEEWRQQLRKTIRITQDYGCPLEIIMNAVSTLRSNPRRLLEWARITAEETGTEFKH